MKIVEFKINNTSIFRSLFESLKEILVEVKLKFTPKGIFILQPEKTAALIVSLELNAESFEKYVCLKDEVGIGIDIINFYKIIKTCPTSSIMNIYYDDNESGKLFIEMQNEEKNILTKYELNLLETNDNMLNLNNLNYLMVSYIPCTDFQKQIKDIKHFTDEVKITYDDDIISFSYESITTSQKTTLQHSDSPSSSLIIQKKSQTPIYGTYSLEFLLNIIKCTNMCQKIKFCFLEKSGGEFLSLIYEVGSLGKIQFILNKKKEDY